MCSDENNSGSTQTQIYYVLLTTLQRFWGMRNPEKIASRRQEGFCVACNRLIQDPINYIFQKKCQLYFRLSHKAPLHRQCGICNPHLFATFNSELLSVQNVRIGESKQQARTNIFVTIG
jgi:hypothetical protein